jgi:hypothetical protein
VGKRKETSKDRKEESGENPDGNKVQSIRKVEEGD